MLNNIAVTSNVGDDRIGHLFWYSVKEGLAARDELRDALTKAGLSLCFMPNQIRSSDAFRRASKEVECKRSKKSKLTESYMVRDVYSDEHIVTRHIVKERVDAKGKRLSYNSRAAVLTLDKKRDEIIIESSTEEYANELATKVVELYQSYKHNYSSQTTRTLISRVLSSLSPTPVRPSGGIYFVPEAKSKELECLVSFTQALANTEGYMVPVIRNSQSLEMVTTKVSDHLEYVLEQAKEIKRVGSTSKQKIQELLATTRNVVTGYKDYEQIFVDRKEELEFKLELLKETMAHLMDLAA